MTAILRILGLLCVTPVAALGALGVAAPADRSVLLINETRSVPPGIYRQRPDQKLSRGSIVALRQPQTARAYLRSLGAPSDMRLLKRVAAAPGDRVCRVNDEIEALGLVVRVKPRDRRRRLLPSWTGCRRLGADEVFLLGDTGDSFDSRYFGPVPTAGLDGVYTAVLTW